MPAGELSIAGDSYGSSAGLLLYFIQAKNVDVRIHVMGDRRLNTLESHQLVIQYFEKLIG
jgi:hypothetical protein